MSLLPTTNKPSSYALDDYETRGDARDRDDRQARLSALDPTAAAATPKLLHNSRTTSTYSRLTVEEVAQRLNTSLQHGLSPHEAGVRLLREGPNELPREEPEPLWLRFLGQFKEPLILLLLCSATISFFLGNYDDAISITLAVTIVITVGFIQEYRSEQSLEALNRLVPHYAHLVRSSQSGYFSTTAATATAAGDGAAAGLATPASTTVMASKLVPGDLVLFSTGDRIPADIRITKCSDLTIDESNLTGENEPVLKYAQALQSSSSSQSSTAANTPGYTTPATGGGGGGGDIYASNAAGAVGTDLRLSDQHNIAFMGTLVRSGYGQGIVIATSSRTEFGTISASLQSIESPRTPLQLSMDRLGQELSYVSFAVIGLIVLIGLVQGRKLLDMFTIGVSLAVAAIPEGLPIIVTVTLALGVLRMANRGAIVRRLPSVETLGSVNVVCSDKTGTLTMNHMTVAKMWHFGADQPFETAQRAGRSSGGGGGKGYGGYSGDSGQHTFSTGSSEPLTCSITRAILRIGNLANNARLSIASSANTFTPATAASAAVLSSTRDRSSGSSAGTAGRSRWAGQPTDVAILDLLDVYGEDDLRDRAAPRVAETPFSSERKWMGVVLGGQPSALAGTTSDGDADLLSASSTSVSALNAPTASEMAYIKGSTEEVLARCDRCLGGDGKETALDDSRRATIEQAAEDMAKEGLRVLAFASSSSADGVIQTAKTTAAAALTAPSSRMHTPDKFSTPKLTAKKDGADAYSALVFAGLVGMSDPPRKDVDKSIRRLIAGGVRVIMITGDAEATAIAIARKLGILDGHFRQDVLTSKVVLRGDEIDAMSTAELAQAMTTTSIFARTSPEHKMKIVRALQSRGDVVAMTGDGVNDAPALKKADIGISMGQLGTDVAKEAADMILTDDDFSTILRAIEQGKGIFYNIQNFITFQLSTSVAALSLVLLSTTFGYKNPLNAMQILWINILMDGPPAQSLGVEPVDHSIMNRPPRPRNARVLTKQLLRRVVSSAALIVIGTLAVYIYEMADVSDQVSGARTYVVTPRDTTMTFTCFVLFDMFNALTCRSESKSVLRGEIAFLRNKMFNYAVSGSLIGQACVVYVPLFQGIFQTEGLYLSDWIVLSCVASSVFWLDEVRKYMRARRCDGTRGYSLNV
ncbi:High affinity Ca2+/Mn2+ P-type ATPase-like protein [Ascosphaera acerosa]|nr:High affinity Ca2+/Mn2+ P-type ATPase-like protein [Ascosphaera acerosa]